MVNIVSFFKDHFIALVVIVVTMLAIPLTVYLVRQQQTIRSKAYGADLVIAPPGGTVASGGNFAIDIAISSTEGKRFTGVDLNINYTDNIKLVSFEKDLAVLGEVVLDIQNPNANPRTVRFVAVNKSGNLFPNTFVKLGKLTFTAVGSGVATINLSDNQVVSAGEAAALNVGDTGASFTIQGQAPPPSGTPPPSPSPSGSGCVQGDADANQCCNIDDYTIWKQEVAGTRSTRCASWDSDPNVDTVDFGIWYRSWIIRANRENCVTPPAVRCLGQ